MQFTREKHSQHTIASTNASRYKLTHRPKLALELAIRNAEKNFNFFSPSLLEKIKTPDTQTNRERTMKLNSDNGLQTRWIRTPAGNSVLPQLAVTCKIEVDCFCQTFVLVDSLVLRNRQLRQHAKRYQLVLEGGTAG
jgi:hypothetical protein